MAQFTFGAAEFATGQLGGTGELNGAFPDATGSFVVNERPFIDLEGTLGGNSSNYILSLTIPDADIQTGNADDGNPDGDVGPEQFVSNSRAADFFLDINGDGIQDYRIRGQNPNDLDVSNGTQEGDYLLKFNGTLRAYALDGSGNETGAFTQLSAQNVYLSGNGDFPSNGTRIPTYDVNNSNNTFVIGNVSPPVPCFVAGTLINTPLGARPIETLKVGDLVTTMDNGPKPLVWIGHKTISKQHMLDTPNLRPILFQCANVRQTAPLLLSPQHRVLHSSLRNALYFEDTELLVPAIGLVGSKNVQYAPLRETQYWHLMFDTHEVVFANNIACESLQPGELMLAPRASASYRELHEILGDTTMIAARSSLSATMTRKYMRQDAGITTSANLVAM